MSASGRRGVSALNHHELRELGLLYRQIAADLATVREDVTDRRLSGYLNQLLGRAHNLIYRSRAARPRGVLHFYREVYPVVFRRNFPYVLAAFAIFLAASIPAWLLTMRDPTFSRFVLGGEMADTIEARQMWTHSILTMKPVASSGIMTNNLAVCFAAAATGITAGVGTLFILLNNGLLLGVIAAACWRAGMSLSLWSFVAPHGALEFPAIFISGGAGLILARGLLFPGLLPRSHALRLAGLDAVQLTLGVIPLLLVAGVIEGFVSPVSLPPPVKFLVSAMGGALLVLYLARAGGENRQNR